MEFCTGRLVIYCLTVCFILLACAHDAQGSGHIEVHFLKYSDGCREDADTNACDPMFSFCLSTPQTGGLTVDNCNYASTGESNDYFHNTNYIDFTSMTSIKGHRNPWLVQVQSFIDTSVMLVIRVRDADFFSWSHDHLQTWGKVLTETIWPSKEVSQWAERSMNQNGYKMTFRIRLYCDPNYYTPSCDKYCNVDNSSRGFCDPATGEIICFPGWLGEDCNVDRDECALGFCEAGTCTNLPGDYECDCPPYATGKNCTDPCRFEPCRNNGTCFAHRSEDDYLCGCPEGWQGKDCQDQKIPC